MWMTRFQKGRQHWGSIAVAVMLCLRLAGCGSAENSTAPIVQSVGTVTGQVISLANDAPVNGAAVKTETGATTTAADGKFSISAPTGDRTVVRVEANGFADAFPVARVTFGQTTNLGVKLVPIGVTETVSVTSGGTVSVPNSPARVTIPANGLVPVAGGAPAGSVNVSLTPINPAEEPRVMPGGFNGIAAGGGSVRPLESGGAMQVDVRDGAGARYTLAPGTTATIRIPLRTQSANPPATMPLWYFDDAEGVWREDGVATLQGTGANRFYEGPVTRVTYWNADLVLDSIVVNGCVKDANGQPVANAFVQTEGIDYTGTAFDSTAGDGTFSVAMRKSSRAKLGLFEFDSQTYNFVPVSNTVNVGPSATDITLPNCLVKQPGPLTITTTTLPGGTVGVAYNQTLVASGGVPGYVWSLNAGSNPLPAGLTLNPAGVISGTPTAAGTTTITLKVTDSTGGTKTKEFALEIIGVAPPPPTPPVSPALAITTTSLPGGTVGVAYSQALAVSGGVPGYAWTLAEGSNPPPAGVSLNLSGVIAGTPRGAGTTTFTAKVIDSVGGAATKEFTVTIATPNAQALAITTAVLPAGIVGTAYNTTLVATGGTGAKSWSISSGTLPEGLSLNASTGVISGTPTEAEASQFTVRVEDTSTPQQTVELPLTIAILSTGGGTGGGGGQLTVSNAPASVGGTFVVTPQAVETRDVIGIVALAFAEVSNRFHGEALSFVRSPQNDLEGVTFVSDDSGPGNDFTWFCGGSDGCPGVTLNRSAGTLTFVNAVLEAGREALPITLNGTLTFTPF